MRRGLAWELSLDAGLGLPHGLVPVFLRLRNLRDADAKKCLKNFAVRETHDDVNGAVRRAQIRQSAWRLSSVGSGPVSPTCSRPATPKRTV